MKNWTGFQKLGGLAFLFLVSFAGSCDSNVKHELRLTVCTSINNRPSGTDASYTIRYEQSGKEQAPINFKVEWGRYCAVDIAKLMGNPGDFKVLSLTAEVAGKTLYGHFSGLNIVEHQETVHQPLPLNDTVRVYYNVFTWANFDYDNPGSESDDPGVMALWLGGAIRHTGDQLNAPASTLDEAIATKLVEPRATEKRTPVMGKKISI